MKRILDRIKKILEPCQPTIPEIVAKLDDDTAKLFSDVLDDQRTQEMVWRATEVLYDLVRALQHSMISILKDDDVDDKKVMLASTIDQFRVAVNAALPKPTIVASKMFSRSKAAHDDAELRFTMPVVKVDEDKRLVFGFFSVVEANGEAVVDSHDDIIPADELEFGAYTFVLDSRLAGNEHEVVGVGHLVESMVITADKQQAMVAALKTQGIEATMDIPAVGWWGGFYIADDDVWDLIKSGEFGAFSIGGLATREQIEER